jgi:DNA-binding transcriptional ArsR family regulator
MGKRDYMSEDTKGKEPKKNIKKLIVACLLDNDVANTGGIADYCGFSGTTDNKYRYVSRQLDALVEEGIIEAIEDYRPEGSRWRKGTGYRLYRDFDHLGTVCYGIDYYEELRPKFRESTWLRELIIDKRILEGEEKNEELLQLLLLASPTFFKFCLLNPVTTETLYPWDTPSSNIGWVCQKFSLNFDTNEVVSTDNRLLEVFRFCIFQDWMETNPDGVVERDLQMFLFGIMRKETAENKRILDSVMGMDTTTRTQPDKLPALLKRYMKKEKSAGN